MSDLVLIEKKGPTAIITLNSPKTANAMDRKLGGRLVEVLGQIKQDRSFRSAILTGGGKHFSAGANIKAIKSELDQGRHTLGRILVEFADTFINAIGLITHMDIPVIAAVDGAASGGGLALALACDVVIASERAVFDPAYVRLGLVPIGGLSALLPALIGPKRAAEFLYLASPLSAKEALAKGIINRVINNQSLPAKSIEIAWEMAAHTGQGMGQTKRLIREACFPALEPMMARERTCLRECGDSKEHRAILENLLQKMGH